MGSNRTSKTLLTPIDFAEFINKSQIFIDKTPFIQEFMNTNRQCCVVARPRRWGKTLSLQMVSSFLQIECMHGRGRGMGQQPDNSTFYWMHILALNEKWRL